MLNNEMSDKLDKIVSKNPSKWINESNKRFEKRGGKRQGSGHPPNPPEYKTLQIRGVPPELYETLQTYCRIRIEHYKQKKC